jgi:hypothetical protein
MCYSPVVSRGNAGGLLSTAAFDSVPDGESRSSRHLVVTTGDIGLWRSMARLQATVVRNFNRQHRSLGRRWQSRYRTRVITTDEFFRGTPGE